MRRIKLYWFYWKKVRLHACTDIYIKKCPHPSLFKLLIKIYNSELALPEIIWKTNNMVLWIKFIESSWKKDRVYLIWASILWCKSNLHWIWIEFIKPIAPPYLNGALKLLIWLWSAISNCIYECTLHSSLCSVLQNRSSGRRMVSVRGLTRIIPLIPELLTVAPNHWPLLLSIWEPVWS